jgi:hypothetical protein
MGSASFPLGKLGALSLSKRQLAGNGILPLPLPRLAIHRTVFENRRGTRRQDADEHQMEARAPLFSSAWTRYRWLIPPASIQVDW